MLEKTGKKNPGTFFREEEKREAGRCDGKIKLSILKQERWRCTKARITVLEKGKKQPCEGFECRLQMRAREVEGGGGVGRERAIVVGGRTFPACNTPIILTVGNL